MFWDEPHGFGCQPRILVDVGRGATNTFFGGKVGIPHYTAISNNHHGMASHRLNGAIGFASTWGPDTEPETEDSELAAGTAKDRGAAAGRWAPLKAWPSGGSFLSPHTPTPKKNKKTATN